jgi:hypothetical protein
MEASRAGDLMCMAVTARRWCFGAVAFFVACVSGTAAAGDGGKVRPLSACPRSGTDFGACLMVDFYDWDRNVVATDWAAPAKDNPDRRLTHQIVSITGRLADGEPARYRLDLRPRELTGYEMPNFDLGVLPYVGRSERNRPIVLTDRGPLEIIDTAVEFAALPTLALVREKDMSLVARYFDARDGTFVVTKDGEVGIWDASRRVCVTPPRKVPGLLVIVSTACRAAGLTPTGDDDEPVGNVVGAPEIEAPIELLQKIYRTDPPRYLIDRVPGTPFLIIKSQWDGDCC